MCLEDFETKREATKILANFERALQNRLGSYQCNDGQYNSPIVTFEELADVIKRGIEI